MKPKQTSRWPEECIEFVNENVQLHPCFYLEEMQEAVRKKFPSLRNTSTATTCRLLRFDLNLSKKGGSYRSSQCFHRSWLHFTVVQTDGISGRSSQGWS
ncbi:TPA: hypothetical protein N0F65_003245 [Lagenidium giganteum]|uniref:Uncharacterized protein n=1 Tax=Lagenidium giganteum TaxID=4803 RepID=A0AAV2ZCH2_9STRA|nr:TPA: hypothetical protein N0F65_003245 [Lagenidium giganteum]